MNEEEKESIEEFRKQLRLAINIDDVTTDIRNDNAQTILNLIEKLQKENEELKKSKITYEAVRDIQEKNRNIVDNNYISKQIVKDNLIKYQEEYELLLEHQSGKESNKTKTLRGRIHMCQELLEGRK